MGKDTAAQRELGTPNDMPYDVFPTSNQQGCVTPWCLTTRPTAGRQDDRTALTAMTYGMSHRHVVIVALRRLRVGTRQAIRDAYDV